MTAPAVQVLSLDVVRAGAHVLRHLTFSVGSGMVTGLLGPSGSGKTTLMRAIVGVQRITHGEIRVLGMPAGAAGLRQLVGYVTQAPSVYADLTVEENLRYFARVVGAPQERVGEVMGTVDLGGKASRVAGTLSGGESARVSLATALLGRPPVLVLDEPTVGLDPVLRRDLWDTFHALAANGTAILVSSHVMDEAERCERLLLLREGALLAEETPTRLRARTGAATLDQAFLHLVEDEQP